jgi:hypothetical protein
VIDNLFFLVYKVYASSNETCLQSNSHASRPIKQITWLPKDACPQIRLDDLDLLASFKSDCVPPCGRIKEQYFCSSSAKVWTTDQARQNDLGSRRKRRYEIVSSSGRKPTIRVAPRGTLPRCLSRKTTRSLTVHALLLTAAEGRCPLDFWGDRRRWSYLGIF